jgi:hypothetical protein
VENWAIVRGPGFLSLASLEKKLEQECELRRAAGCRVLLLEGKGLETLTDAEQLELAAQPASQPSNPIQASQPSQPDQLLAYK